MSDERPVVDMKDVLEQRQRDGKPLIIIEPQTASKEVVEALKKCLPEDQKHKVTLVNFENIGTVQVSVFEQESETLENSQTNTYKLTDLAIKIITFMRICDFNVNQKFVKKSMNKYWDKLSILEKEGIDSALQELVDIEIITSNFLLTDKGFKTIYTPSQCFYEFKGWDGNIPQYEAILNNNKRWFVALKP